MILGLLATLAATQLALAETKSIDYSDPGQVQPYIEKLKKQNDLHPVEPLPVPPPSDAPATQPRIQESSDAGQVQPYLEKLRQEHDLPPPPARPEESKRASEVQPHLEAVKVNDELQPKFKGKVNQAAGFSIVASNKFDIKSDKVQANSFENVYNTQNKYSPSADVFYEYQVYRDHYIGAFSVVTHLGAITTKGKGIFTKTGAQSTDTNFSWLSFPVSIGGGYRFVQMRYLEPYVELSAVGIPFIESRDDDHPSRKGISRGYNLTGGLALSLDWISRKNAWDLYDAQGVLHTYLIAQLEVLRTISGSVTYNYNGTYLGLMFEF